MSEHWSAELNHNYRNDIGEPQWILRYDPTPGGTLNEDGSRSLKMNFPALVVTEWVADPEESAGKIAATLNSHDKLVEALGDMIRRFEAAARVSGSEQEFISIATANARAVLDAALPE